MKRWRGPIGFGLSLVLVQIGLGQSLELTTLAGMGPAGSSDGPVAWAQFVEPLDVALDREGNRYVADTGNHVIRKVSAAGVVTTVAGLAGVSGHADGPSETARLNSPSGVAVDEAGNLYIADRGNHALRKVTPGGWVSTLLGLPLGSGGQVRLDSPEGVAVDAVGRVYVADSFHHVVRVIDPSGQVSTLAGLPGVAGEADGTGEDARLSFPSGVALGPQNALYVADSGNGAIRRITPAGAVTTVATGLGVKLRVAVAGNIIWVADAARHVIWRISPDGEKAVWAGSEQQMGDADGMGQAARFRLPGGLAWDPAGFLVVADTGNHRLRRVSATGEVVAIGGASGGPGNLNGSGRLARFAYPEGVAVDQAGRVYVADRANHAIRRIAPDGTVATIGDPTILSSPEGVAVDAAGQIYVADTDLHVIRKLAPGGAGTILAGASGQRGGTDGPGAVARFDRPAGVAVDAGGSVYVVDTGNHTLRKISPAGSVVTLAGSAGQRGFADGAGNQARFNAPAGVAVDAAGQIYVADTGNHAIRRVSANGAVSTLAGGFGEAGWVDGSGRSARFDSPRGIAASTAGYVYVADTDNHAVRRVTPAGQVSTLAGGVQGNADGVGNRARLNQPSGLAMSATGQLYVSDTGNHVVREGRLAPVLAPTIAVPPEDRLVKPGDMAILTVALAGGSADVDYQWFLNGRALAGAQGASLVLPAVGPEEVGLYTVTASNAAGQVESPAVMVGLSSTQRVVGAGRVVLTGHVHPATGNVYDQVLLEGPAATITASPGRITRISFLDEDGDIVQVEFSGAGTLTVALENFQEPATAQKYNQPDVAYVRGRATIAIAEAGEHTHVSIFSVGRLSDPGWPWLFRDDVSYEGVASIGLLTIASADGRFGGVQTANARYARTQGLTGLHAPGVRLAGPVYVQDIAAAGAAEPVLVVGAVTAGFVGVTGGSLAQPNGQPVRVEGVQQVRMLAGQTSHAVDQPAKAMQGRLVTAGHDVTETLVVGP